MSSFDNDIAISSAYREFFTAIDLHFAWFVCRHSQPVDPDIFLAAALVSRAAGNGDICLDLEILTQQITIDTGKNFPTIIWPELNDWLPKLKSNKAVGQPGQKCPLIIDANNRLYLYRYWEYEQRLVAGIEQRVAADATNINSTHVKECVERRFPSADSDRDNWQKVAVLTAILKNLSIVTGGPGTGKTYTLAIILTILFELEQKKSGKLIRISMAAPTGKAASRLLESIHSAIDSFDMQDAVKSALPREVHTIHRLLKTIPGSPYFRYNAENKLPLDVVVVDEASMVDLALMSKLFQAIPSSTRIILAGDKDQLASVAAGSVFGDLCDRKRVHGFSSGFLKKLTEIGGQDLRDPLIHQPDQAGLQDSIVILRKSHRFDTGSGIHKLSQAVKKGDHKTALSVLRDTDQTGTFLIEVHSAMEFYEHLTDTIIAGYRNYLQSDNPLAALQAFKQFQILCAVNEGPFGVRTVNRMAEQVLAQHNLIEPDGRRDGQWYAGRPVLIKKNDYQLGLFNGDIGITMRDPDSNRSSLFVFFPGAHGHLKRFLPYRLPEHETVYAMTVHKSQGSEFDKIVLILPQKDFPVLTRELIYTGLTRAKQHVSIWGTESILRSAITRKIERTSGLRDALWKTSIK